MSDIFTRRASILAWCECGYAVQSNYLTSMIVCWQTERQLCSALVSLSFHRFVFSPFCPSIRYHTLRSPANIPNTVCLRIAISVAPSHSCRPPCNKIRNVKLNGCNAQWILNFPKHLWFVFLFASMFQAKIKSDRCTKRNSQAQGM